MTLLRNDLSPNDPFEGFDADRYPLDLHGWGSDHPIFRQVLAEAKPQLVIEVGTWKGASAIHMARCLQELGLKAQILCVDTWLGAIEFWGDKQDPERYLSLGLKNGYPTVYYQFLANVAKAGFQDVILPFPQTSMIAARWLFQQNVQAQAIYIDASHEEEDVFQDLCSYWKILAPGGIMFGDDYDQYWPSVRAAVRRFSQMIALAHDEGDGKWVFRKPSDAPETAFYKDDALAMHLANTTRFEVVSEQLTMLVRLMQDNQKALQDMQHELRTTNQALQRMEQESQARNRELCSLQLNAQRTRERLGRWENWFRGVTQSHTWRWFARFTIGRQPLPLDQEPDRP